MSDPFGFSDFPDLSASFKAAREAVTALCYFQTDLDNLIREFALSAKARSAAAEHDTSETYELGVLLVRQAPHVVAGFLAQYQLCFPDSVKAVETHVKPLMNELGSVRVQEFQVGIFRYRCAARMIHKTICRLHMFIGAGRIAIPKLLTVHVPEWREVLEKHGWHIRPFVERYYHAKAPQPDSGAGEDGPAKTLSEVWNRVRAEPDFQHVLRQHTLEVRIQNMFRLNQELLGGWDPDSVTEAIHFEHTKAATERRKVAATRNGATEDEEPKTNGEPPRKGGRPQNTDSRKIILEKPKADAKWIKREFMKRHPGKKLPATTAIRMLKGRMRREKLLDSPDAGQD